ncbi:MAG: cytochrome c1 [Micavibrio sp.]|nr:cytochrome c1 [Micavibrio sp.]
MKKTLSLALFALLLAATAPTLAVAADAPASEAAAKASGSEAAAEVTASKAPETDKAAPAEAEAAAKPAAAAAAGEAPACPEEKETPEPAKQVWPHKGVFGRYDMASVQRGFQVYKEVCSSCHAMKFMSYRDLAGLGYTPDQIKSVAGEYTVTDGPNDDGEMFERPARPSDHFKAPFANDKAARAANGGALPPDMSLLVKAREHGEDYIYALLNGYEEAPACATKVPGGNWNKFFPGHHIKMPKPLADGQVSFSEGAPNNLPDEARDVVQFLAYASEPHMEARKFMGIKVILFLLVFAGIMRAVKRKVWQDVK